MYTTKQKGFTIVELLIVIVVIAILAAISIVAFTGIQQRGRDSARVSDVNSISKALTAYTADGNAWPAAADVQDELEDYTTANLSAEVIGKISADAPTETNNTVYGYAPCGSTGANLTWYKEQDNAGVQTVTVGSC